MTMIQLHYYPSTASMAPHILLEELGVPYERVLVDRTQDVHKTTAYLKLNPNGLIPVLTDGDLVLYETAAICLHLCDTHPAAGLAPALGTPNRAHFYKWLIWFTNTLQATLMVYFHPERWVRAHNQAGASEVRHMAHTQIHHMLRQVDTELARHAGPWMLGNTNTALAAAAGSSRASSVVRIAVAVRGTCPSWTGWPFTLLMTATTSPLWPAKSRCSC